MKRIIFLILLVASPLSAQSTPRFAIMDDWVREYLAAEWDAHAKDSVIVERGYCLTYQLDFWADELAYRVTKITQPDSVEADANGIAFTCPKGKNQASLHVHPPQTCLSDTGPCWDGGVFAYQCMASEQDERVLTYLKQPFGMVQCDRNAVISFMAKPKARPDSRVRRYAPSLLLVIESLNPDRVVVYVVKNGVRARRVTDVSPYGSTRLLIRESDLTEGRVLTLLVMEGTQYDKGYRLESVVVGEMDYVWVRIGFYLEQSTLVAWPMRGS